MWGATAGRAVIPAKRASGLRKVRYVVRGGAVRSIGELAAAGR